MTAAPLETVAPDARDIIRAFREAGSVSFQDRASVEESREAYRASCSASAPRTDRDVIAEDARAGSVPVRIYRPIDRPQGPHPAVLFLHGGGWVIGDLDTHDGVCRYLAAESDATVVAVDYRLAPEHRFPAAHDDSAEAAAWLLSSGAEIDVDPTRVVVIGDSAGGGLAADLARRAASGRLPGAFRAQVLLYPVVDLRMQTPSYGRVKEGFPLTAASMQWFADHYAPAEIDRAREELSPLAYAVPDGLAPALVVTVGHDPLADEGIEYAAALAHAGVPVEHRHLPRHAHGLVTSSGRIPTGIEVLNRVAAYVRAALDEKE